MLSGVPVRRLSTHNTSNPSRMKWSQRWLPMKPAPPVMRTRSGIRDLFALKGATTAHYTEWSAGTHPKGASRAPATPTSGRRVRSWRRFGVSTGRSSATEPSVRSAPGVDGDPSHAANDETHLRGTRGGRRAAGAQASLHPRVLARTPLSDALLVPRPPHRDHDQRAPR